MIQTEEIPHFSTSEDSCTCGHDDRAFGDFGAKKPHFNEKINREFYLSKTESNKNYGTATEHELTVAYPKQTADRFEAEYDYCMRWASDYKYVAAKVIPFQSNFYSVVRLMFHGRNWVLDCHNYEGQYDYCGWLPSVGPSKMKQKSLLTDSSDFTEYRQEAGKTTLRSSDTGYGLISLKTDYSGNSALTKDPIDSSVYKIMGAESIYDDTESNLQNSLHSTLEDISPILGNNMVVPSDSVVSTNSSLKAVLHDLVELDQIFAQQVEEAEEQRSSLNEYVNGLTTAHSFSESVISTPFEYSTSARLTPSSEVLPVVPKSSSMFAHLACLTGKKINIAFWKNWSKPK